MANSKKPKVNVGDKIGIVAGVITTVVAIVKEVVPLIPKSVVPPELPENYILVPPLCSKNRYYALSEAKEILENSGLKPVASEVHFNEVSLKYRDCFEFQVVSSEPKANSKVRPGRVVTIKYVTQEIINESQRLFEEAERQKAAAKQERAVKRAEQMDKTKAAMSETATKAKAGVGNIIHRTNTKKDTKPELTDE